jgi:hypothetical protein
VVKMAKYRKILRYRGKYRRYKTQAKKLYRLSSGLLALGRKLVPTEEQKLNKELLKLRKLEAEVRRMELISKEKGLKEELEKAKETEALGKLLEQKEKARRRREALEDISRRIREKKGYLYKKVFVPKEV